MSLPKKSIQPLVLELLALDPTPNNEYTTQDLQEMAYAVRIAEFTTPELLAAANALDNLSDLTPEDIKFIRSAGRSPIAA